jgi:murein DD-endopeptidase MepM/ murein hydrolase activator NlpD
MPSSARSYKRAVCAGLVALLCFLAAWQIVIGPVARAATIGGLQQQISSGQGTVSSLSGALGSATGNLNRIDSAISALEQRLAGIQADLDAKRAALARVRVKLAAARVRLAQLEAFDARAERILARLLVSNYETDRPDLITVVLNSTGFQNLLERLSFAQRIRTEDVTVIRRVKAVRHAVTTAAIRLGALQVREQTLTDKILRARDSLAAVKVKLYAQEIAAAQVKADKAGQLARAKDHLSSLHNQLAALVQAQQHAAAQAAASTSTGNQSSSSGPSGVTFGPISSGGGFVFPMPKADASPPGSWSLDNGVDISAPGGTPELAVCSGTIVLHGLGGFGPDAPILHCDSPVGGFSYVYYGHAGPANQLPIGTHVGAGQVMSEVGPGIVGISTGPHLEIGFCDASGALLGSAGTMLSLLRGAYGA